ncbi:hypothetical protein, conserved [Eimeria brunetti]|uniref:Peroxisomal membrane protein PEX16 n=1 Tax=Eimeria brunetti TaxID=51314 RepID=U6LI09_9EIME|nr:hypothetical protein, conserved [Eimeria brunetti]
MPRKRWADPRRGGAHVEASRAVPPSHETLSASSIVSGVSKEVNFSSPAASESAPLKSESVFSTYGGDLTEREGASVCPPPTLLHSVHTSDGNNSASPAVSPEDTCAFHSPRSLPGDSPDAGLSVIKGPPEADAGSLCADTVDSAEQLQRLPEASDEGSTSPRRSSAQHSALTNQQLTTPSTQEEQRQQPNEGHHEQQLLPTQEQSDAASFVAADLPRISPSETEGEWIRLEEPNRQSTEAANPGDQSGANPSQPFSLAVESPAPLPLYALEMPREQAAGYPVCIGSATQAEEGNGAEHSSIGSLSGTGYRETSEGDCWAASSSPAACSGTKPVQANRKGVLARLSLYAKSVACSLTGHLGTQQELEPTSPSGPDDSSEILASQEELSELESQATKGPRQRGSLLQGMLEWHRCILEMYGATIEDVTRLALQVLPAHATDDQSERRFLIIQGLFDVFCLYRSHILSPPGLLLHAEALHHQWKHRRACSLDTAGISRPTSTSRTPAVPSFDAQPMGKGANTVEGLPTSVRLSLYGAVSLALKIVRALQLLLEVSALRRGGDGPRFALCLRLELLKLILKLMLRALTPFAFYCDEQSICQALATQKEKQMNSDSERLRPFYGRRTGRKIPPLPSAAREPVLGEVLYHIRPFIHLYLLKRARNTKSWTPWLVAIFIEANAVSLLHGSPQVMERLSPIEAAELHHRMTGLPYALLRPPFFDKFLARPVEAIDFVVRRVPLLNHFNVLDAFLAYRDLYFTTSNT